MLPAKAIAQLQRDINRHHDSQLRAGGGKERQANGQADEHHSHDIGELNRQHARGNRAEALGRMFLVLAPVLRIVNQVDGGSAEAEDDEGQEDVEKHAAMEQRIGAGRGGGGQHQDVFDPLLGAQGLNHAIDKVLRRLALAAGIYARGVRFRMEKVLVSIITHASFLSSRPPR